MHVRVDEPGENRGIAEIVNVDVGRHLPGRNHRPDMVPFEEYGGGPDSLRSDHLTGDKGLQTHGVKRPPGEAKAYRGSFTFSTRHHREFSAEKSFARFQAPLILASFSEVDSAEICAESFGSDFRMANVAMRLDITYRQATQHEQPFHGTRHSALD